MRFAPKPVARAATLTFLFADLRGYTTFTETLGDAAAAELIAEYRIFMRAEIAKASGADSKASLPPKKSSPSSPKPKKRNGMPPKPPGAMSRIRTDAAN
jgi:class 3 adenylate cyclase